jgi:hypothetical protein
LGRGHQPEGVQASICLLFSTSLAFLRLMFAILFVLVPWALLCMLLLCGNDDQISTPTIQINHQPDATIFQFIIMTFI